VKIVTKVYLSVVERVKLKIPLEPGLKMFKRMPGFNPGRL
jgi:hypothetical protein